MLKRFDQEHFSTWADDARTVLLTRGDCFRACMAMLVSQFEPDIELGDVPHFFASVESAYDWASVRRWFDERGYQFCDYTLVAAAWKYGQNPVAVLHQLMAGNRFYALGGESPRCRVGGHGVVMQGDRLFHDPHPSRTGIYSMQTIYTVERAA